MPIRLWVVRNNYKSLQSFLRMKHNMEEKTDEK